MNAGSKTTDCRTVKALWTPTNVSPSEYKQEIFITGDLRNVRRFAFCLMNPAELKADDSKDSITEIFPGYYAIDSDKFNNCSNSNDTVVFNLRSKGNFTSVSLGIDGAHLVMDDGTTLPVAVEYTDIFNDRRHYANEKRDRMAYGDSIFRRNEEIKFSRKKSIYDVIPSFKEITLSGKEHETDLDKIIFQPLKNGQDEEYHISVKDGKITVSADKKMWLRLKKRIHHFFGSGKRMMPDAEIKDYPDLGYRGLHIDIARNYQEPEEIIRILDWMAVYGLNRLHFHIVDDEAWRLEIKAYPELTEIGSKRGYSNGDFSNFLPQRYSGDGNPYSGKGPANGYYSQEDYKNILRHADSLGIAVILEIEAPGHGRAAIMAMKERARRLNDTSILLSAPGDTSSYTSAQGYHDNVMDPTLPAVYDFIETVIDEISGLYRDADAPLLAIHIGGDEVAAGAWNGNAAVADLMKREGLESDKDVHAWFMKRLAGIFKNRNLRLMGWQEIAEDHGTDYDKVLLPVTYGVNLWFPSSYRNGIDKVAQSGYPLIISNVDRFYLDMVYSGNPEEKGLSWGGEVDEFKALGGYPHKMCPSDKANIIGVQGQTWSETVRTPQDLENLLFPKMTGMAERAWNNDSTYSEKGFNAVIAEEISKWDKEGINYHVRQPGIMFDGNEENVAFNSPYPFGDIRYTLDGSDPTESSAIATEGEPIPLPSDTFQVRARLFINGKKSATSVLDKHKTINNKSKK